MIYSTLIFAFSLSLDAFGIGLAYGFRRLAFPLRSKCIAAIIAMGMLSLSLFCGTWLFHILPSDLGKQLSMSVLCLFGLFFCIQPFLRRKKEGVLSSPSACDKDASDSIEPKEAVLLGVLLSLDSCGVSMAAGAMAHPLLLPPLAAAMQILLLSFGEALGKRFPLKLREDLWPVLSGLLLFCLGIYGFLTN